MYLRILNGVLQFSPVCFTWYWLLHMVSVQPKSCRESGRNSTQMQLCAISSVLQLLLQEQALICETSFCNPRGLNRSYLRPNVAWHGSYLTPNWWMAGITLDTVHVTHTTSCWQEIQVTMTQWQPTKTADGSCHWQDHHRCTATAMAVAAVQQLTRSRLICCHKMPNLQLQPLSQNAKPTARTNTPNDIDDSQQDPSNTNDSQTNDSPTNGGSCRPTAKPAATELPKRDNIQNK